jgi:hypothetical protein
MPESARPQGLSDYDWEVARIVTLKVVAMEGGLMGAYAEQAIALYALRSQHPDYAEGKP